MTEQTLPGSEQALPGDNGPALQVDPLVGALGAEVRGIDLKQDISGAPFRALNRVLLDHGVIFLPDQHLTPQQHVAFARAFGELFIHPYLKGVPEAPELVPVVKEADETVNFGGEWHSDFTYLDCPPKVSVLAARELPPPPADGSRQGGDTLFVNMTLAYDRLSPGMKRLLEGLRAVHSSVSATYATAVAANSVSQGKAVQAEQVLHPVVRTHPETGRRALFVNPAFTRGLEDMSREESDAILGHLYRHACQPEFAARYRWRQGAVGIWDNRCTMHFPLNDYQGQRREMHRATVQGDRPF